MNLIESVESEHIKSDIPDFGTRRSCKGSTPVSERVQKNVSQAYEGTVIRRSNGGLSETFTVRRVAYGEGSERTFPAHSPNIESNPNYSIWRHPSSKAVLSTRPSWKRYTNP